MTIDLKYPYWPHNGMSNQIQLHDFRHTVTGYLQRFQSSHREVAGMYQVLSTTATLLPSDCDQALDSVKSLQESIQILNSFLDSTEQLPNSIIPKRYSILFSLHYLDEISNQLLPLIRSFRKVCLEPSRATDQLQTQVLRRFETLLQTSEKIQPASETLLD